MTGFDEYERQRWAGRAEAFQRSYATLCGHPADALLDAAGVGAGTRMLDVGTGSGTVAGLAFARQAVVTAVDAEPSMVELAGRNVPQATVSQAVLPRLPFVDGCFDAVVANFVLNHVGDPAAAVAELRRIVRPGGRIAATIWPYPAPPLQRLWGEVFAAAGAQRPAAMPALAQEKDFDRTADGFARLFAEAKLTEVACVTISWVHRTDPEDWWSGPASGLGSVGLMLESQPPEMLARIRQHYDRLVGAQLTEDGTLALPTSALLVAGRVG